MRCKWYMLGTTVQLLFSLGLHRSDNSKSDAIIRECRKRAFWACSTLDTYLSVIMGVPALINLEEVDQVLPEAIDDDCLTTTGVTFDQNRRDSIIQASISHAWIMRIVKRAAREQYLKERKRGAYDLETAARYNAEVNAWQSSLPAVLSGAIHPSSLVATFRRQLTVIKLAHAHAQMLINRPSLLVDSSRSTLRDAQVQLSLQAAEKALDTVLTTSFTKHIFQAFWLVLQFRLSNFALISKLQAHTICVIQCHIDHLCLVRAAQTRALAAIEHTTQGISTLRACPIRSTAFGRSNEVQCAQPSLQYRARRTATRGTTSSG